METCDGCGATVPTTEPMFRIDGHRPGKRRTWVRINLLCGTCWRPEGVSYRIGDAMVSGLYGAGEPTPPTPCAGCGRIVVRGRHPRLRSVTCSRACTVRASKGRGVADRQAAVCAGCGEEMSGRADRRYCSPACRQRAYRQRKIP
jgi:hypothetical protein